ncbi:MAG: hypothetical protein CMG74_09215 [Candidatus Marinimicrobia bacterium]|nr:hypothetical protein [Candidatus Neomarinimicrobiota bacterium]
MFIRIIIYSLCFFTCATPPAPKMSPVIEQDVKNKTIKKSSQYQSSLIPIVMPPTKKSRPDLVKETVYSRGYLSGYDIWEFLREDPAEQDVLETIGLPDSVWLDYEYRTKFLYYFISEMQDYNIIEISTKSDSVSGFEWD